MTKAPTPQQQAALDQLLSTSIFEVSARLFVTSFRAGAKDSLALHTVRNDLAALTGVRGAGLLGGTNDPEHDIVVECTLLWERSLLAARFWAGDSASPYVQLLRRGKGVRASRDPYKAAHDAVTNMVLPSIPG